MNTNLLVITVINKVRSMWYRTFKTEQNNVVTFIQLSLLNIKTMIILIKGNKAETFRKAVS